MEEKKLMTEEEQVLFASLKVLSFKYNNLTFEELRSEMIKNGFEFAITTKVTVTDEKMELYRNDIKNLTISPDYISNYIISYNGKRIVLDFKNKEFLKYLIDHGNYIAEEELNKLEVEEFEEEIKSDIEEENGMSL